MIAGALNQVFGKRALRHMMEIVKVRPVELDIETTNFCPSRCVFCPNSKSPRVKKVMEMELFEKICRDYYELGGGAVGICSMQSDIFSDELLMERLELLKKYRDRFVLHAATMLFGAAKFSDRELASLLETFDCLDVSMGGLNAEDYRLMYGVNGFDQVIAQLFRLAKINKESGINTTLALNIRTHDRERSVNSELLPRLRESYLIREIRTDFFSWGGMILQSDLPVGAKLESSDNSEKESDCVVPWSSLCVTANGSAVGCGCVDWEPRHILGNLSEQSILQVWQGRAAREFRTSFSERRIPALCRDCTLYTGVERAFGRFGLLRYQPADGCYHEVNFPFSKRARTKVKR